MEAIRNTTNEIMFVGAIYKQPDLLVDFDPHVRKKYDFFDEATRFFYSCASVMYSTRTQDFNKTSILTFMAEDESRLAKYKEFKGYTTIQNYMQLANPKDAKTTFRF